MINKLNRYEIKREIGRGGMAVVYLAHDPHFERDVVVKLLTIDPTSDSTLRERFRREAKTIAGLEHPAIVPVYDYGEEENKLFIVMRYMTGGSLADRIHEGSLSLDQAAVIMDRVCSALDASHQMGIIHRDLKPSNILFDRLDNAYLADFGIARSVEQAGTQLTADDKVIGTPGYMSPEQIRGEKLDRRSDIYALGAVVFEMLTGRAPFQADSAAMALVKQMTEPAPSPRSVRPDIPSQIESVVMQALERDRQQRPSTASEIAKLLRSASQSNIKAAELLESMAEESPISTLPPDPSSQPFQATEAIPVAAPQHDPASVVTPPAAPSSSRGWVRYGGGAVLLALILIGGWWIFLREPSPPAAAISTPTPEVESVAGGNETDFGVEVEEEDADDEDDLDNEPDLPEPPENEVEVAINLPEGVYENFDNNSFNPLRLQIINDEVCDFFVENGALIIENGPQDRELSCGSAFLNAPALVSGEEFGAFGVRILASFGEEAQDGFTGLAMFHEFYDDDDEYIGNFTLTCGAEVIEGQVNAVFFINDDRLGVDYRQNTVHFSGKELRPDRFFDFRLFRDGERIGCMTDGYLIGEWFAPNIDEFVEFDFAREIRSWRLENTALLYQIDEIGWVDVDGFDPPENEVFYDGFDTAEFDFLRWNRIGDDECEVFANEGIAIFRSEALTGSLPCSALLLNAPVRVPGWRIGELEAFVQLNAEGDVFQEGGTGVALSAEIYEGDEQYIGQYDISCLLNVVENRPFANFSINDTRISEDFELNSLIYTESEIELDTWYSIKIGFTPESRTIYCLLNDQVIGEFQPDDPGEIGDFLFFREIRTGFSPESMLTSFIEEVTWRYR